MPDLDSPSVYQLRIRIDRISPLIWRRLLVRSDTTLADLHTIIQTTFAWTDSYLHRFVIHGKSYGIAYRGGITFADDPTHVRLTDCGFRTGEQFRYAYDFHDLWQHVIRIEQILPTDPGQHYSVCIGGARAAPPEDCGGPRAFLALRQHSHPLHVIERLLAFLEGDEHDDPHAELRTLQYWAAVNRFDQCAVNFQLRQAVAREPSAMTPEKEEY